MPLGRPPRSLPPEPAVASISKTVRVAATSQQLGGSFTNPLGTLTALEASVIEEKRIALIPAEHLQHATEGLGRALRLLGQQIQALAPSDIG